MKKIFNFISGSKGEREEYDKAEYYYDRGNAKSEIRDYIGAIAEYTKSL